VIHLHVEAGELGDRNENVGLCPAALHYTTAVTGLHGTTHGIFIRSWSSTLVSLS